MKFSCIGEEILAKCRVWVCCRCAVWVLCLTTVYCARALQTPVASHKTSRARRAKAEALVLKGTPGAPSPADAPARPATVTLKDGILTVEASNSDLSQILKDVADVSGMTIDGSVGSARVYGVYGPRNPRDVLTKLLTGSGYNFIMVGVTHEGAPRELLLTDRERGSTPITSSAASASDRRENTDTNPSGEGHLGPGAIVAPPASSPYPEERVQQNLQRLEKMHDQQQKPPQ
jgi:hypothetical protein